MILRGVNLSNAQKSSPYLDATSADDWSRLRRDFGFDAVRLVMTWAAIEPERDRYDDAYLDQVAQRMAWASDAGLAVILDMHDARAAQPGEPHLRHRIESRAERRIRESRLPVRKTFEAFDFGFQPKLDKGRVMELATLRFVAQGKNVLLAGMSGTGKSRSRSRSPCWRAPPTAACSTPPAPTCWRASP